MMAAFSRAMCRDRRPQAVDVVEVDVGHDGDPAVPGMGRVQATAQPDLDEGDVQVGLREVAEDDRGQELELGRVAVPAGDAIGDGQDRRDVAGEVGHGDGRAVDDDALAVRHEVRLGRLADAQPGRPERAAGDGQHAALAVRPGDEGAAHGELRVAELAQERAGPAQAEPDAEPTAVGERGQGRVVLERVVGCHGAGTVTRGSARPRRTRTG